MDAFMTFIGKIDYIIVHMTSFELPLVLWATALASWRLATVLDKHNSRQKEAKLARRIAAFSISLSFFFWVGKKLLS